MIKPLKIGGESCLQGDMSDVQGQQDGVKIHDV